MKHSVIALTAFVVIACGLSSDTRINKSIVVEDGAHKSGGLSSVNGSITVGNEATVDGDCSTVNGKIIVGENAKVRELSCVNGGIELDRNSKAKEVSCVNGSIKLGGEVKVDGDVSTVNGSIHCENQSMIAGDLSTVNGDMSTEETMIVGDVRTVNGDIELLEGSIVKGKVVIDRDNKRPRNKHFKELFITVDSASKVNGNIEVKGDDANVTVVLAGGGEVLGEIINAKVIRN